MPTLQDLVENYGLTQGFGVEGPFGGSHTGVDLGTPAGTPVPALGSGTIASIFYDPIGGQQVKVRYDSGAEGWFAHLGDIYSQVGERVGGETIIGASGDSGQVTGPHLHYEIHDPAGQLTDPLDARAQTFIGGGVGTSGEEPQCPLGYTYDPATNSCRSWVPGGIVPNVPVGPNLPAWSPPKVSLPNPLDPVGAAVGKLGDDLARGTKQIAVAAVIVGVVVVLGFSGVRRTLS